MGDSERQGAVKWKACATLAVAKRDEVTSDSSRMFAEKNGEIDGFNVGGERQEEDRGITHQMTYPPQCVLEKQENRG